MPDHANLLADLRAAAAIEQSDWPQADKARNARDVLARHGHALIELVEREGEAVDAEREAIAALIDREAHTAGAQGYNGEPKHTDYHMLARRIRARKEAT